MRINIKNCNNIDVGTFDIVENRLNIKYAINGTGRSTISKAIDAFINDDMEKRIRVYLLNIMGKIVKEHLNLSDVIRLRKLQYLMKNILKIMYFNKTIYLRIVLQ